MRYPIAIEPGTETEAFGVVVPDLPGCFSAGDTMEEAMAKARLARAICVLIEKEGLSQKEAAERLGSVNRVVVGERHQIHAAAARDVVDRARVRVRLAADRAQHRQLGEAGKHGVDVEIAAHRALFHAALLPQVRLEVQMDFRASELQERDAKENIR
jgi:predicted RNase H-like HicB family nuclease